MDIETAMVAHAGCEVRVTWQATFAKNLLITLATSFMKATTTPGLY